MTNRRRNAEASGSADALEIQQQLARRKESRAANSARKQEQAELLKDRGNELFAQGDYGAALTIYQEALDLGPNAVIMSNLAATYLKLHLYQDAEETATSALGYDPRMIKARYRRGIARLEMGRLRAAITDFKTILAHDPSCEEARERLDFASGLQSLREDEDNDDCSSDNDEPHFNDDAWEISTSSDTSDYRHAGNGISCRFYNHNGCSRGDKCFYSHAPDNTSVRDNLGKNVCLYFLLGMCKFGASKCIYSHTKAHLPQGGWWEDKDRTESAKEMYKAISYNAHLDTMELRFLGNTHVANPLLSTKGSLAKAQGKRKKAVPHTPPAPKPTTTAEPGTSPKRFIMLLSLGDREFFESIHKHAMSALRAKLEVVTAATPSKALELLSSLALAGVFVTDPEITKRQNTQVLSRLVQYAKDGGSVVVGGLFSSFIRGDEMDAFFQKAWGLKWKRGDYYRSTFSLNSENEMAQRNQSLTAAYSMKALNVTDISPEAALYRPTEDSRLQSMVFAPEKITNLKEAPVVQTRIGKGSFGYLGDVNGEESSTNVVLAMLGLLDSPNGPPPAVTTTLATPSPTTATATTPSVVAPPTPVAVSPRKRNARPFVMVLSFGNKTALKKGYGSLLQALQNKLEVVQGLSNERVIDLLASPDLIGILVTESAITRPANALLLAELVEYARDGGTVVLGGYFASMITLGDLKKFFGGAWGLPWTMGPYTRLEVRVNRGHSVGGRNKSLPEKFVMKAVHVAGITHDMALYTAAKDSGAYRPLEEVEQGAIVYAPLGKGHLGFIGDVNPGKEHTKIVLSMFGLLD